MTPETPISIVTKWWIKDGCRDEAIPALAILAEQVCKKEPFTAMYLIHTSVAEGSQPTPPSNEVIFVGTWVDRAAFNEHLNGPVFQDWAKQYKKLFLADDSGGLYVAAEFVERRAGFIRESQVTGC
jgi:quinol monooxygenase YgiN